MINKLLITCLQRNKRLIIPELGAFIRKNIEGVGVILVFVPFLKKDDGVLVSAFQSWAGVEVDEAQQILEEYVAQIKQSLDSRGQYIIEGIGVLKYDANGVIYLAKESDATVTPSQRVLSSAADATVEQQSPRASAAREDTMEELAASARKIMDRSNSSDRAPINNNSDYDYTPPRRTPLQQDTFDVSESKQERRPSMPQDDYYANEPRIDTRSEPRFERPNTQARERGIGASFFTQDNLQQENNYQQQQPTVVPPRSGLQSDGKGMGSVPLYGSGSMYSGPITADHSSSNSDNHSQQQQQQQRSPREALYGGGSGAQSNQQTSPASAQIPQPAKSPLSSSRPTINPAVRGYKDGAKPKAKKAKGSNTVFVIAIIAIVVAVGVLLYGMLFGKEAPIMDELIIEQTSVTDNTTEIPIVNSAEE